MSFAPERPRRDGDDDPAAPPADRGGSGERPLGEHRAHGDRAPGEHHAQGAVHGHARHDRHDPAGWRAHVAFARTGAGRLLVAAVALLAVATVVGLVLLWPGEREAPAGVASGSGATVGAEVVRVIEGRCPGPAEQSCRSAVVAVDEGPRVRLDLGPSELVPDLDVGDAVRVQPVAVPEGLPKGAQAPEGAAPYVFAGVERRGTLLWLAVAFGAMVIAMARWRGLLAIAGFVLSLALVVRFVVPAILDGRPALLVALVGALAVMFVTVALTYGLTAQSAAAAVGIAITLSLATAVGALAIHTAKLDGRSGELASALTQSAGEVSLQGIVLAGLVLGCLGVLADMAVTQASAVMAVRRANPRLGARRLYREGYAVGRDHLVATTHTLMLAYAGATLPLLLVLQSGGVPTADALNLQDLSEPIVATLVGSMALLVSVPITTGLAAAVVARIPASALPEGGHDHAH
ncbi:YibE/F family protein [Conexibacter arvalis]|uniref:Putative membrane protein n=1 Tax=Conexibacter arvalis TaxID=912552 RepID=A0A840IEV9_9ACTN|nr:YibE/F family protein [Conexibacter arvalis]MBB4662761.1 putative membrane protein [Conexibacter arvalis]